MKSLRNAVSALILLSCAVLATASDVVTWDQMIEDLRLRNTEDMHLVYFGSPENTLARRLHAAPPAVRGVRYVFVDPTGAYQNPLTGRMVPGSRIMDIFSGTAGTIVVVAPDGIPVPALRLPQALHNNSLDIVRLYAEYASNDHYRALSLGEFARAIDREDILNMLQRHAQMDGLAVEVPAGAQMPVMITDSGQPIRAQDHPSTFFIVGRADGRALRAQVDEIGIGFRALSPPIMVVLPPDVDAEYFTRRPFPVTVIRARREWIASDATPRTFLFGEDRSGVLLRGFRSHDVLSSTLGLPPGHAVPMNLAIPLGEVDE